MNNFYKKETDQIVQQMYALADILCERNKQIAELQARLDVTYEINNNLRDELQFLRLNMQDQISNIDDEESEVGTPWEPDYEAEAEFERLMFGSP